MWKRWLLGLIGGGILFLVALILTLPWWFSPKQAEQLANRFLAPDYSLQLADSWQLKLTGLQLAHLKLQTPTCLLADAEQVKLNWWNFRRLNIENLTLDYGCVTQLPTDPNSQSAVDLTALFAALPISEVDVSHFQLKNTASLTQSNLQQLLQADIALNAQYTGEALRFSAQAKAESAVILQHHSELIPANGLWRWQGQTDYQPELQKTYHLTSSIQLENNLLALPQQGSLDVSWDNADFSVAKGTVGLSWQGEKGQISGQDLARNQPLLDVPFTWNNKGLEVTWGTLYWTFDGYQPVKAFLGLNIKKPEHQWLPLNTDLNMIFQTFGEFGKGEIVISGQNGEIGGGERFDQLHFDLKTRGDLRYNTTVAQTNLEYKVRGTFAEPWMVFSQGAIFKMDNVQSETKLHVRLPLDNVVIGRYGLEGRLQATLQGSTPQFEQLDLKLDGYAHEFIAGVKTVFDLRDERQNLRSAELKAANRWDWNVQGSAIWKALKTKVNLNGLGFWEADHIELTKLNANSGDVNIAEVKMSPLFLELKDRLRWDYEKEKIRGLLQAQTDWIEFAYGGRFEHPIFGVGIDGKSIGDFSIAGELKAGLLGPLDISGHYQKQALTGKIAWKEQSAKVFQSLFPQKWEWIIHRGTIKGKTDFLIDENGVLLDGELKVKKGEIQLPDGEIKGLNIDFPLHYQDLTLQAKAQKPLKFYMDSIRFGALEIQRAKMNAYGYYPNSLAKPLILSQVHLDVFDGDVTVDKLSLPQQQLAVLNLKNIDLSKVLTMAQYNQIYMQGRINATLPFRFNHKACLICQGTITQAEKLNLKLDDEVVKGLKAGGWTESILVDVVKNLDLETFNAKLTLLPTGEMDLAASIKGYNSDKKTHNPITLNYTHKENMFELWKMIDYGSQFEQNLEYRLYQQAEKTE